jgi:FixJ family two-component response regulator
MVIGSLISVVDDDESVRESIPDLLKLRGLSAIGAALGRAE